MSGRCGGMTGTKEATDEVQEIVNKIRADVEGKTNQTYGTFVAKIYATQVVAGVNYFIKVDAGNEHLHLRVFRSLQGDYSLHSVQEGKNLEDELLYF